MKTSTLRRIQLLLVSLLILVLAQGFNAALSVSSFEKIYRNSLSNIYGMLSHDLQRNVEGALRFGKPLDKFMGLDKLVQMRVARYEGVDDVIVALRDGTIVRSSRPERMGTDLADIVTLNFGEEQAAERHFSPPAVRTGGMIYTLAPLHAKKGEWVGTVAVSFSESMLDKKMDALVQGSIIDLAQFTGVAFLFILLGLFLFVPISEDGHVSRKRVFAVLVLVMGVSQVAYSVSTVRLFGHHYREVVAEQTHTLATILRQDVEFLLGKGIRINRLRRIDFMLSEVVAADPEIRDIRILDMDANPLFMANRDGVVKLKGKNAVPYTKDQIEQEYDVLMSLNAKNRETGEQERQGVLRVRLSKEYMDSVIRSIMLDSATVVVLSFMLLSELLIFVFVLLAEGMRRAEAKMAAETQAVPVHHGEHGAYGVVRPAVFILLMAVSLSHSFLPLYMEELYEPIMGLSREIVVGLPISMEMLAAGVMILVAGAWIDRRGWHEPFLAGALLCAGGSLLSGIAGNQIGLILARGVFGLGYGLSWMAAQGFVLDHTDAKSKARGMASFVAAVYAGGICGAATGGMLVERIGYQNVFLVSTAVCLFALFFAMAVLRSYFIRPEGESRALFSEIRALTRLVLDRNVLLLLVARSIPTAVLLIGFLYYFCPVYLDLHHVSKANIARVMMIFGFFMIYIAPLVSRWVDRTPRKKWFIVFSGLVGGAGLMAFFLLEGMWGVIVAVTLFSVSFSFASSSQVVYFLNLECARSVGAGEAMGAYRALEKIGQVIGPIAVAAIFGLAGVEEGMAWLGVAAVAVTLLFALVGRENLQRVPK